MHQNYFVLFIRDKFFEHEMLLHQKEFSLNLNRIAFSLYSEASLSRVPVHQGKLGKTQ